MNTRTMSHTSDPATSATAASQVNPHDTLRLKHAIIDMLEQRPLTADEMTTIYYRFGEESDWPYVLDAHNIKRRLSELHKRHHVIRESGLTRPSRMGRAATVWELALDADEARAIVNAS